MMVGLKLVIIVTRAKLCRASGELDAINSARCWVISVSQPLGK